MMSQGPVTPGLFGIYRSYLWKKAQDIVMARLMKLSGRLREIFLSELRKHGVVSVAARAVDVDPRQVHNIARRDEVFKRQMDEARAEAVDGMEREAIRRATEGVETYVVQGGKVVRRKGKEIIERKYSDQLLMFLMKGNSAKYRDSPKIQTNVGTDGTIDGDIKMMRQAMANLILEGADLDSVGKVLRTITQLELAKKQLESDTNADAGACIEVVFTDDPNDY